jgi:hypothetical protein
METLIEYREVSVVVFGLLCMSPMFMLLFMAIQDEWQRKKRKKKKKLAAKS